MAQLVDRAQDIITAQNRLRSLLDANRSIVSELTLAAVLRRIVDAARDVAEARYAALGVIGADGSLEQFVHVGMDAATVAAIGDLPKGRGVLGALIADPQTIRLHAITDDPRSSGFPEAHPPMQTFLGVPIQARGEVFGNLYLTDRLSGDDFTAEDEELIEALAATASIAIENARLYEESRLRQEWLKASAEISRSLLEPSAADDDDALRRIADSVRRLADADLVSVVFPDPDHTTLSVHVARGHQQDELAGVRYPMAGSLAGAAITQAKALRIDPQESGDPYYVHLQSAFDVGPVMACPLSGDAGVRGAIIVGRRAGRLAFTMTELDMAQAFAIQAAIALELADARADQQRLNVLEDRHRIARDLHDHVIQRLFATGLTTQATLAMVADPRVSGRLAGIVDDIDDTIRQIRSSIFELNDPADIDGRSLRATVLKIVTEVEPVLGFRATVSFDGPVDTMVDDDLLRDAEAALREGLTNIGKHAAATAAAIRIILTRDDLQIEVRDNGTKAPEPTRRSGLANLADRAHQRRGSMDFHHDQEGTVLRWTAKLIP